jgi:hypothetical protein
LALDWAFCAELNDNEVPLAEQMRLWEQDELRKMQEEGLSPFTRGRTVNGTVEEQGLDLGRLEDTAGLERQSRGLGYGRFMNTDQVEDQVGAGWKPDEWIRTSVWILEAIGGGHYEGVALHGVSQGIRPSVYTA